MLLALGAFFVGAGVILRERAKEGTIAPPLFAPPTFGGLATGGVYRLWATLERGYGDSRAHADLERELSDAVRAVGFSEVLLAGEDPSDPRVWTFLARWGQIGTEGTNLPPLSIYAVEEIDEVPATTNFPPPSMLLDADLSPAEAHAVDVALTRETDPAKLDAFSESMMADFPLAGMLLQGRAQALREGPP